MDNPIRKLFDPAALPQRDEEGFTHHPDLARFYDGPADDEGFIDSRALREAGWECSVVEFEFDHLGVFNDSDGYAHWEPSIPMGTGWILAGIWDAEDGPIAYYVREIQAAATP